MYQQRHPVDLMGIAREFGINVFTAELGPNLSGLIRRDPMGGSSGYVILVNKDHPPNRQRFTIAHELAHFVLHCGRQDGEIRDDQFYRFLPGPLEREANELAAEILMPWTLINRLTTAGVNDLADLAKELMVSRQALAIRLGIPYDQDWS
ncbi:ImmA/IrrE family metallo-endopeptidase [Azospirillum argentinense]